MLNRLYIVVGVLAILALAAAFVVPSFIPWGAYRERMAAIAGEVLGAPVRIDGDIHFSLLPQPKLEFETVRAGPADAPNLTVAEVVAEFSLVDFLRDRYTVTSLRLVSPRIAVNVGADGSIDAGLALPERVSTSNISVANAVISDGAVTLSDARSGETYSATDIAGELKLEALRGPYSFQGGGVVEGQTYQLRITTGALDEAGAGTLAASLRPADGHYALSVEGTLASGLAPSFSGTMSYRQPPPKPADPAAEDAGQGDLVMTSKVEASPSRVLLSDYIVIPDENRAATRLLGAADVTLGAQMSFNAVISGGLLALPPRDATTEQAVEPYELVRLLRELPIPAAPALPGTIGVDVAELNLRAFSLRNVRLDASAAGGNWTVRQFSGELPGGTTLGVAGQVTGVAGHPEFSGTLALQSESLDALSALWRKPAPDNPLFGMSGGLAAKVDLVGETLSLSEGKLTLDGETRSFAAQLGVGSVRDIHFNADLGQLDPARSAALFALLPDVNEDAALPVTFPKGEFNILADTLSIGGLAGKQLSASGSWDGGVLVLDNVSAGDLGGARFEVSLTAFGSFERPELSGSGTVRLASADAPALAAFFDAVKTPPAVRAFIAASMPADLALKLAAPSGEGAQALTLAGMLGTSDISADAQLEAGFLRALSGSIKLKLDMKSADAAAATAQLGLGDISIFPEGEPVHLVGVVEGNVANSLETTVLVDGGGDSLGFSGNVVVTDPEAFTGKGTLKATLSDLSGLAAELGAAGLSVPPVKGTAIVEFDGTKTLQLSAIDGTSGGQPFSGALGLSRSGGASTISGEIAAGRIDIAGLLSALAGPAALINGSGTPWPDGPLATGEAPRTTSGRIKVTSPALSIGGVDTVTDLGFDFDWDATAVRLRGLTGKLGGGDVALELAVCCSGPLADKQVTGRLGLTAVALDSLAPPAVADALSGTITAAGRFDGTGGSVASVLGALTGEGTYSVDGLAIERLDPGALAAVAGLDSILETQPADLTAMIEDRLDDGPFISPAMAGSFTIAGGVLRSPNVTIEGPAGGLFGSAQLRLADLGLSGGYVLSATAFEPAALLDASSARISTSLGGTLLAPERSFDVSGLVDAIMVKAYEAEVARLEKLRAEDEARQQAEAAEKARLAAEQEAARKAAEEIRLADEAATKAAAEKAAAAAAAKQAADEQAAKDAAAKKAADEAAAKKKAQEEAARKKREEEANRPMDLGLGN